MTIDQIKANYQKYDDEKILRIAKTKSRDLREDIIPVLIEEIKNRGLNPNLITWIKAESKILSQKEIIRFREEIKQSYCDYCKRKGNLKAYEFRTKVSFIFGQSNTDYRLIVCEECIKGKRKRSELLTLFFGWWSVSGFFSTPFLLLDKIMARINEDIRSDKLIDELIDENVGKIILTKDETDTFQLLIRKFNKIEEESIM